ncbi:MAG: ribosomal RNA small subunit methyltransferase A [bacterium]|nr:ribosomal RNA small subunit methyltransferase A [bacterium]
MARLGQHFLVNKNVAEKIARRFLPVNGPVLEIGPGKGILTGLLVKYRENNPVTAIELDNTLFYKLKNKYEHIDDFQIQNRDILKIQLSQLFPRQESPVTINIIGNVPYYISKELMDWVIVHHQMIQRGVFMMQKEFVDKVMHTQAKGVLQSNAQSVILNLLFRLEKLFDVQPGSFSPHPKVKSTVFLFEPLHPAETNGIDIDEFYVFLKQCFMNRRKTLLNNLSPGFNTETLWEIFESTHINPRLRAEQLKLEEFRKIYLCLRGKHDAAPIPNGKTL